MVNFLEKNADEQTTISNLVLKMAAFLENNDEEPYTKQYMKKKLEQHFKDRIIINSYGKIPGGGGGALRYRGGAAPSLRISRKKGSFFKTSACPRFCKRRVLFCTQVRSMGVKIPLQSTKYTRL